MKSKLLERNRELEEKNRALTEENKSLQLTLLSGHTLRVFEGFDAETLTRLLRVIDQQC